MIAKHLPAARTALRGYGANRVRLHLLREALPEGAVACCPIASMKVQGGMLSFEFSVTLRRGRIHPERKVFTYTRYKQALEPYKAKPLHYRRPEGVIDEAELQRVLALFPPGGAMVGGGAALECFTEGAYRTRDLDVFVSGRKAPSGGWALWAHARGLRRLSGAHPYALREVYECPGGELQLIVEAGFKSPEDLLETFDVPAKRIGYTGSRRIDLRGLDLAGAMRRHNTERHSRLGRWVDARERCAQVLPPTLERLLERHRLLPEELRHDDRFALWTEGPQVRVQCWWGGTRDLESGLPCEDAPLALRRFRRGAAWGFVALYPEGEPLVELHASHAEAQAALERHSTLADLAGLLQLDYGGWEEEGPAPLALPEPPAVAPPAVAPLPARLCPVWARVLRGASGLLARLQARLGRRVSSARRA